MISIPARLNALWPWFSALWSWDYNDPRALASLIRESNGDVPVEFAQAVADIVSGTRKPNKKAAAKLTIPAREMATLCGHLLVVRDLRECIAKEATYPDTTGQGAKAAAQHLGVKPLDVIHDLDREWTEAKEHAARMFSVEVETVERLFRDFQKRLERWPEV